MSINDVTPLPEHFVISLKQELEKFAGARENTSGAWHPLTGTIAVYWTLRTSVKRPVYVVGFDLAFGAGYDHYDGVRASQASLHKYHRVHLDSAYLNTMKARGEIELLDAP